MAKKSTPPPPIDAERDAKAARETQHFNDAMAKLHAEHSANIPVPPVTDAPAPAAVPAAGLRVLVEQESGDPLDVAADAGQDGKPYRVRINGALYDHCSEDAAGRWIYRKG